MLETYWVSDAINIYMQVMNMMDKVKFQLGKVACVSGREWTSHGKLEWYADSAICTVCYPAKVSV